MRKREAVLGCTEKNPTSVIHRAEEVELHLTGNLVYVSPNPALTALTSAISDATISQGNHGTRSAHGSTADLADFKQKTGALFTIVKQLCAYVNNTTPNDEVALAGTGYPLSADPNNLPLLDAPLNFHRFIVRNIGMEKAKLKYDRPQNAATHQDVTYKILRATTNSFATATVIGESHKTSYIDIPAVTVTTTFYYFVQAISAAGTSEPSAPLAVQIVPLPI